MLLGWSKIAALDVLPLKAMKALSINATPIKQLDLTELSALETVYYSDGQLVHAAEAELKKEFLTIELLLLF